MLVKYRDVKKKKPHDVKGMATLCLNEGGGHRSEVGLLNTSKVTCGALYLYLFICLFAIEF